MAKKYRKSKKDDYFNMSVEEQMENANIFYELEKGVVDITEIGDYEVKQAPVSQSGFNKQLTRAILGEEHDEDRSSDTFLDALGEALGENYDEESGTSDDLPPSHTKVVEKTETVAINNRQISSSVSLYTGAGSNLSERPSSINYDVPNKKFTDNVPRVHFRLNKDIGKLFIEDGLVSTPVSLLVAISITIDTDMIPGSHEEIGELFSELFYYIISCKYPAIIMNEDTFDVEFSIYENIDKSRFVFFRYNKMIFGYVVEHDEVDNFRNALEEFDIKDLEITDELMIKYIISTAMVASDNNNKFLYEDDDEVEYAMEIRHNIKDFTKLLESDPKTEYSGHRAGTGLTTFEKMGVIDLDSLRSDVHAEFDNFIFDDEYEDEDDDDFAKELPPIHTNLNYDDSDSDKYTDAGSDSNDEEEEDEDDENLDILSSKTGTGDIDAMMDAIEEELNYDSEQYKQDPHKEYKSPIQKMEATTRVSQNNQSSQGDMVLPIIHRK